MGVFGRASGEPSGKLPTVRALIDRADSLTDSERYEEALAAYDAVIDACGAAAELELERILAKALHRKGYALGELGRTEEEIAVYDELVARFDGADDAEVLVRVCRGLCNKGITLGGLGREDDESECYEEVITRVGGRDEPVLQEPLSDALAHKAWTVYERDRFDEALAIYESVIAIFGGMEDEAIRRTVARAMIMKAACLESVAEKEDSKGSVRAGDSLAVYDAVIAEFGGDVDADTRETVARAMVNKGFALAEIDRPAEAIAAYDEAIARIAGSDEPGLRLQLAWAMLLKAGVLVGADRPTEALACYDELLDTFESDSEADIQARVCRALSVKAMLLAGLGRQDEADAICEQLVARDDDAHDPTVADDIAWAMLERNSAYDRTGRPDEAARILDDLVLRFGEADESDVQGRVAEALLRKSLYLIPSEQFQDALRLIDEAISRLPADADVAYVADVHRRRAIVLENVDRRRDALAAYDDGLRSLAESTEPRAFAVSARVLLNKAQTLWDLHLVDEAAVVFDGASRRYRELPHDADRDTAIETLALAALALVYKTVMLCRSGRGDETAGADNQLVELLGDVQTPQRPGVDEPKETRADAELAALLARTMAGDCWIELATSGTDGAERTLMATRALDLYARSQPWLDADVDDWDESVVGAVTVLRTIGDGYAMLSETRWAKTRTGLPLPNRPLVEWVIRRFEIDQWSDDLGHPLDLREPDDDSVELLLEASSEMIERSDWDTAAAPTVFALIRTYELLGTLCDSPSGRSALQTADLRECATWQIATARSAAAWIWHRLEDVAPAAAAMVLIAQAFFVASHGRTTSSAGVFPRRAQLRELFEDDDVREWLANEGIELPPWLKNDGD